MEKTQQQRGGKRNRSTLRATHGHTQQQPTAATHSPASKMGRQDKGASERERERARGREGEGAHARFVRSACMRPLDQRRARFSFLFFRHRAAEPSLPPPSPMPPLLPERGEQRRARRCNGNRCLLRRRSLLAADARVLIVIVVDDVCMHV